MSDFLWVTFEPNGRIIFSGTAGSRRAAEAQGTLGVDLVLHDVPGVSEQTHYVDVTGSFDVIERPALTPFADGPAPHVLDMAGLPAGTLVRATNNAGASVETSDPADPVRLTAPGAYAVQIRPPFPWRDINQTVEVSDA